MAIEVVGQAAIEIIARIEKLEGKLRSDVGKAAESAGKEAGQRLSASLVNGLTALGAGAAAAKIKGFLSSSFTAFQGAEEAQVRLNLAFKQFPNLAGANVEELRKMNTELDKQIGIDDDVLASSEAILARYDLTAQQIKSLIPLVADYARATGQDVSSAAETAGKALLGQGRALKAIGIQFVDTGSVTGNFTELMNKLQEKVGGVAKELGDTAGGKVLKLKTHFEDLKEQIGGALLPAMTVLIGVGEKLVSVFSALPAPVTTAIVVFAGLLAATVAVTRVVRIVKDMQLALAGMGAAGRAAATGIGFLGKLGATAAVIALAVVAAKALAGAITDLVEGHAVGLEDIKSRILDLADGIIKEYPKSRLELDTLDQALADLASSGHVAEAAQALRKMGIAVDESGHAADEVFLKFGKYNEAVTGNANASRLAASGQEKLAADTAAAAAAADDAAAAIDKQVGALFGLLDANLRLADANSRLGAGADELTDKQKTLADAIRQHGRSSKEAITAQRDYSDALRSGQHDALAVAAAALQAAQAQADLSGHTLTSAETFKIQHDTLVALLKTIDPKSPLYGAIKGLVTNLDSIVSKNITVDVNLALHGLTPTLAKLLDRIGGRGSGSLSFDIRLANAERHEHGGRASANRLLSLGERGPEFGVFDSPSTIFTTDDLRRMLSSLDRIARSGERGGAPARSGGNTFNILASDPEAAAEAVARRLSVESRR